MKAYVYILLLASLGLAVLYGACGSRYHQAGPDGLHPLGVNAETTGLTIVPFTPGPQPVHHT